MFFLLTLLTALPAPAQEDPEAALLAAIAARDPWGAAAALAAGARPDRPASHPAAFALTEALAATPDEATRGTVLAFAEAAHHAGFGPEMPIAGAVGGSGGSLVSRLASIAGEEALFLRVASLTVPERRCTLLGQLIFGREGANFAAAAAVLPMIPTEQAASPACSLPFTMLTHPARRPPPTLVEAMLAAGLRPYPDALAALLRLVPPGEEGEGAFGRLAALDLGAPALDPQDGERRRRPVLAQLGEEVLVERAPRAESLRGRWGALLEAAQEPALCAALPGPAIRGWLALPDEAEAPGQAELLRGTTETLLRRCPANAFAAVMAEEPSQRLWPQLVARHELPVVTSMLEAGLRPADLSSFLGALACTAEPQLARTVVAVADREAAGDMLARFMGCLGGLEAAREGDRDMLAAILEMAPPDAPVAGDAPIAVAIGLDRADIAEELAGRGAASPRLMPERLAFWRHRRLAALAQVPGPSLPWEEAPARVPDAPELVSLAPGLGAWIIRGECGPANCGFTIAAREGRGYRLVLEDVGESLRLEPPIRTQAREVTIRARGEGEARLVTTWRYDGRVYRRHRCIEEDGEGARRRACPE
ncbi:hypothetical protein [Roseococcus pinisoli]|uniref:HEAT repeat domain-containing protein n=1 Tax=Roseococcus pinisoli TaxID=2835040 RepID=A0ABS5QJG3_9PROT|nr:hypothetical protein [Roseococcus pinisoli]MBS7813052.1 hypothetical protein [Roseococcus pinisoli]